MTERPDYTALIEEAKGFLPILRIGTLIHSLADAVKALESENAALLKANGHVTSNYLKRSQAARDAEADVSALRAQLDGMTTEWRTDTNVACTRSVTYTRRVSRWEKRYERERSVGPWVEVTD